MSSATYDSKAEQCVHTALLKLEKIYQFRITYHKEITIKDWRDWIYERWDTIPHWMLCDHQDCGTVSCKHAYTRTYEVDFLLEYPDFKKIVLEVDGEDYHEHQADFKRDSDLRKNGIGRVVRIPVTDELYDEDFCIAIVQSALKPKPQRGTYL